MDFTISRRLLLIMYKTVSFLHNLIYRAKKRTYVYDKYVVKIYNEIELRKGIEEVINGLCAIGGQNIIRTSTVSLPKIISKYRTKHKLIVVFEKVEGFPLEILIRFIPLSWYGIFRIFIRLGKAIRCFHSSLTIKRSHTIVAPEPIPSSLRDLFHKILFLSSVLKKDHIIDQSTWINVHNIVRIGKKISTENNSKQVCNLLFRPVTAHLALEPMHVYITKSIEGRYQFILLDIDGISIAPAYFDLATLLYAINTNVFTTVTKILWGEKIRRYVNLIRSVLLMVYLGANYDEQALYMLMICEIYVTLRRIYHVFYLRRQQMKSVSDLINKINGLFRIKLTVHYLKELIKIVLEQYSRK